MAYTIIDDPTAYFQVKTYAGTGNAQGITLDGNSNMQPDWVWFKNRTISANHALFDSVRGATKVLGSNTTTEEATEAQMLKSFDSNGFTVGTDSTVNDNDSGTINIVSWNWKAGTSFTNDASSTGIGSIDSAGSVNTDAGFAIISYTGTGSAETIAHGLGTTPALIISRKKSDSGSWFFWNKSFSATQYLSMDTTNAVGAASSVFGTLPTSTVYSTGGGNGTGASSDTFISYVFAEKQGYSKFGSYTGNGNADGTYVHLGFKPAFVLIKITDNASQDWFVLDNKRSPFNLVDDSLAPNQTDVEYTSEANLDFTAQGFKLRMTSIRVNGSGNNYIYMAFSENPFTTSTGIPTTAR